MGFSVNANECIGLGPNSAVEANGSSEQKLEFCKPRVSDYIGRLFIYGPLVAAASVTVGVAISCLLQSSDSSTDTKPNELSEKTVMALRAFAGLAILAQIGFIFSGCCGSKKSIQQRQPVKGDTQKEATTLAATSNVQQDAENSVLKLETAFLRLLILQKKEDLEPIKDTLSKIKVEDFQSEECRSLYNAYLDCLKTKGHSDKEALLASLEDGELKEFGSKILKSDLEIPASITELLAIIDVLLQRNLQRTKEALESVPEAVKGA